MKQANNGLRYPESLILFKTGLESFLNFILHSCRILVKMQRDTRALNCLTGDVILLFIINMGCALNLKNRFLSGTYIINCYIF